MVFSLHMRVSAHKPTSKANQCIPEPADNDDKEEEDTLIKTPPRSNPQEVYRTRGQRKAKKLALEAWEIFREGALGRARKVWKKAHNFDRHVAKRCRAKFVQQPEWNPKAVTIFGNPVKPKPAIRPVPATDLAATPTVSSAAAPVEAEKKRKTAVKRGQKPK